MVDAVDGVCCEDVREPGRWPRYHTCGKRAKVERAGKKYCGIHDPDRLRAIRDATDAKYKAELAAALAKRVAQAEQARDAARWRKSQELFYSTFLQVGSQTIQFEMPSDLTDYLDAAIEHDRACHAPKD